MRPFLLSLLLFICLPLRAEETIPPVQIKDQDSDQSSCYQRELPLCIKKCQANSEDKADCAQLCEKDIRNQCLYSGE